jgi:hypothetical protein
LSDLFLFSVPSGEPVSIEPFNYAIAGQTQFSGKTTLLKRLAMWAAEEGFRVLIFDTKDTGEEYSGFGRQISVCMRETTDPFVLIGLLESIFRRRLTRYYATLTRVTEGAEDFDDMIKKSKELESKTRSSWLKDACRVLYDLLERLKAETRKVETVPELQLQDGINRMVINDFSLEAQQLIIKNAFEDALRKYKRDLILVLDEAFKFIPQGYSSAATQAIMQVITQGGRTRLFTWISTQFLAITDKDPLKACPFKFLGTQDHITEVKHTLDLVPEAKGRFTTDDVMKRKVGHWILVRKRPMDVRVVYSAPLDVPVEEARKVARGELTPEIIRDDYLKKMEEEEELIWKERYEEEKRKREEVESEFKRQVERLSDLKAEEKIKKLKADYEKLQSKKDELEVLYMQAKEEQAESGEISKLKQQLGEATEKIGDLTEGVEKAEKDAKLLREFREVLGKIVPMEQVLVSSEPTAPSEISVTTEQPLLSVKAERKTLNLTDKDLHGRIAIVYAESLLPEKSCTTRQLNKIMEQRFGQKEAYANFKKVLTDFVAWGYFEKVQAGKRWDYRVKMKVEDAKAKGLLKVED